MVRCTLFLSLLTYAAYSCYSTMDVKSIIQQWYKELAEDAEEFEQQAQRVSVWDQQLRENQKVRTLAVCCYRAWLWRARWEPIRFSYRWHQVETALVVFTTAVVGCFPI
jgi:hypothetical protein